MSLADRLWNKSEKQSLADISKEIQILISDISSICSDAKIYVFGSFAANTAGTYSDIDLAVILPDDVDKKSFRKKFYLQRTAISIPVDFIFRNQSEFKNPNPENPVDDEILSKGVEIYPTWSFHG
jgi:predicted nucleotidyltransferase